MLLKVIPQIGIRASKKRLTRQIDKTTRKAIVKVPVSIRMTKNIVRMKHPNMRVVSKMITTNISYVSMSSEYEYVS